ncbi:MAG: hypothetical protein JNG90_19495 [Planctomycetaceae bacterium]|nr:hypothetical protein [Planctomycetaceae bacterium]
MTTEATKLTLRDLLELAGKAIAQRDGLSPAGGVQRAYELTLTELAALGLPGTEEALIVVLTTEQSQALDKLLAEEAKTIDALPAAAPVVDPPAAVGENAADSPAAAEAAE